MSEIHVYPPSPEFVKRAHVKGIAAYHELYERAKQDPPAFWADIARKELTWFKDFDQALEWEAPFAKWFVGGKINASYNCLDRHLATPRKNKAAIIFEGEPGDQRFITYQELHRLVCRFATVLKNRGLKAGDRAIIYMPMIPELPVALLACARLGVIHSVVFGGFSAEALRARIEDLGATVVITADGGWRRGKEVRLKDAVDESFRLGIVRADAGRAAGSRRDRIQAHRRPARDAAGPRPLVARSRCGVIERRRNGSRRRALPR